MLDVEAVIDSLISRLDDLGSQMESLPTFALRQVLTAFTASMEADMHTREVVMTVRVPKSAIINTKTPLNELCLETSSQSSTVSQAQNLAVVIATIRCEHNRKGGKQCFSCRRSRKAA